MYTLEMPSNLETVKKALKALEYITLRCDKAQLTIDLENEYYRYGLTVKGFGKDNYEIASDSLQLIVNHLDLCFKGWDYTLETYHRYTDYERDYERNY